MVISIFMHPSRPSADAFYYPFVGDTLTGLGCIPYGKDLRGHNSQVVDFQTQLHEHAHRIMGHQDQFAKRTFAEQTELITRGALLWRDPPELQLVKAQLDGQLLVQYPDLAAQLLAPWSEARTTDEIALELKMPGDHLDIPTVERALLRRQARQVERVDKAFEQAKAIAPHDLPLWIVAPHIPLWTRKKYHPKPIAEGCYRLAPFAFPFLWIAANELPLADELLPFLIVRSGQALDDFGRWAMHRCAPDIFEAMLRYTNMSTAGKSEWHQMMPMEDIDRYPIVKKRTRELVLNYLKYMPGLSDDIASALAQESREKGLHEGRVKEVKSLLRAVLKKRSFALSPELRTRIRTCQDISTLERWLLQAVTASSVHEALR